MGIFDELTRQYLLLDQDYAAKEFSAVKNGWVRKEKLYRRMRDLNDQAYFLFMFSRLEDRITQQSTALIAKKKRRLSRGE